MGPALGHWLVDHAPRSANDTSLSALLALGVLSLKGGGQGQRNAPDTAQDGRSGMHDKAIGWIGVTQHLAGDLFDEIWMGRGLVEQGYIAGEFRPHGLEAPDLKLQQSGAIDQ